MEGPLATVRRLLEKYLTTYGLAYIVTYTLLTLALILFVALAAVYAL